MSVQKEAGLPEALRDGALENLTLVEMFGGLPEEVQLILANMMFNMGRTRLSKFKNMNAAVEEGDWNRASQEMMNSRWYNQVRNRARRLVERMRNV